MRGARSISNNGNRHSPLGLPAANIIAKRHQSTADSEAQSSNGRALDSALFSARPRSTEDSNQKSAQATSGGKDPAKMNPQHSNPRRPPPRSGQGASRRGGGPRRPFPPTPNRKRKSDHDGSEGPAPRRARLSGNHGPIHDPRYILQNKPFPKLEDYPEAPPSLFQEESVIEQMNRLDRTFGLEINQKNEQARTGFRVVLQGHDLKGNSLEVIGEGYQKVWVCLQCLRCTS